MLAAFIQVSSRTCRYPSSSLSLIRGSGCCEPGGEKQLQKTRELLL